MKLVSWNLNGLRSAWNHGLPSFLETCGADIYALQETKVDIPYVPAELEGYHAYWSCCAGRKGYSGTLCLTRYTPLEVRYDMGDLDPDSDFNIEGRIITLEFEEFFFVNCYTPNFRQSEYRRDYRNQWDERFLAYIRQLNLNKPVILCGDFNGTASELDVYEGNQRAERDGVGFQSTERESLHQIIGSGFVDTFRHLHPEERKYSWWSTRLYKRREDRGMRLDYFFVSEELKDQIREADMLTEVLGSDHCPILLETSLAFKAPVKGEGERYIYQGRGNTVNKNRIIDYTNREELATLWNNVNWEEAQRKLDNMQHSLTMSAYARDLDQITKWQKRIVRSAEARLLAVKETCKHAGGAGVDGIKWTEPHEKMSAALALQARDYHAAPARMLLVKSKHGKERRIHIESYYDRAMQQLYAYTLDPVAEAWADRKSFAYREGRSLFDMNENIKQALSGTDAPEWVFISDVKQCYESISHEWIMRNIPMEKRVLSQFLKAGYVFGGRMFPMQEGVGIGCAISPIVANMTLDGLQRHIYACLNPDKNVVDFADGEMMRYADDILVIARTEETARRIQTYVAEFLEERGLMLSADKSRIIHVSQGFDFTSRNYYKSGTKLLARPSNGAIERFMTSLRDTIEGYTGSQQSLIRKINDKTRGWATYHKTDEAEEAFRKIDKYITALLIKLCQSKHPKWDMEKILRKYWYYDADGRYYYALPNRKDIRVNFMEDTQLIYYEPVRTSINPYADANFVAKRAREKKIDHVIGVYRGIWNRQNGCCYCCGRSILRDDDKTLIEVDPKKSRFAARMAYVHTRCLSGTLEYIDTPSVPASINDLRALLLVLEAGRKPVGQKFYKLYEYFRNSKAATLALTFAEIEDIMGEPLGRSARQKQYWYRTGFLCISQCWLMNGYTIQKLRLREGQVEFTRAARSKDVAKVGIPEVFLNSLVPVDAKYELEYFFSYIIKKFGL